MQQVCEISLLKPGHILLAMKKRGLGEGKWNGPGGKLEPGETPLQAIIRETQEEIGVTPINPRQVGHLKFYMADDPNFEFDCYLFAAEEWEGEPIETDEMTPQWFRREDVPYDQMWPDDRIWFPMLFEGQLFEGTALVDSAQGNHIVKHDIKVVKKLREDW